MSTAAIRHPIRLRKLSETGSSSSPSSPRDKNGNLIALPLRHLTAATYQTWVARVPSNYTVGDLLDPAVWRSIELDLQARAGRPQVGDFLRCIADDGSFDAVFTIEAVERGSGYRLRFHHGRLPEEGAP